MPTTASADAPLTTVSVHINVLDASGDVVAPDMDKVFMNVWVDGESVFENSTGTGDGENFAFSGVPIYETGEYFVWVEPESKTPGFLKTGEPDYMPSGQYYYPILASTWTGLTADPTQIELNLEILDPVGGSVCGAVVDIEDETQLAAVDVTINSTATINGIRYALKDTMTTEESGTYCFEGLPFGHSYTISFDPSAQLDSRYSDANYQRADESVHLRAGSPARTLVLYTWIEDDGDAPTGDLSYVINAEDPNGNSVSLAGLEFWYEGAGSSGSAASGGNSLVLTGLAPGQYTLSARNNDGVRRAASTSSVFTVSNETGAPNESIFVVYTTPEGSGGISGTLDWDVDFAAMSELVVSMTAVSIDTPWTLPAGSSFDVYYEATPSESGEWSFDSIPDGQYRLTFPYIDDQGSGQAWTTVNTILVTVDNGESVNTGIQSYYVVESSGDTLSVKVKNNKTRLPVAGATCSVQISDEVHTNQSATSNTDGVATFGNLFRGYTYDVSCNSSGRSWGVGGKANAVTVHAGENLYVVPFDAYDTSGRATGRVLDENGNPLDGIRVSASQTWTPHTSLQGDYLSVNDTTAEDGTFQLEGFLTGRDVTMTVIDRSHALPTSTFTYRADSAELVDLGDLVLRVGAEVTGQITDVHGDPVGASVILREIELGNEAHGQSDAFGVVSFDEPVPLGDYTMFVATSWGNVVGQLEQGYATESGELSMAVNDAVTITIADPEPAVTELPDVAVGSGATISGAANFVDAIGNPLTGSSYDARAHFYVQTGASWQAITMVYGWASSDEMGGQYQLSGLPAGHYKVCFRDYYTSINRFAEVCNGGTSNLNAAPIIVVDTGETVTGVNVGIKFRRPETPPQPINFDEVDDDVLAKLEDQIEILDATDDTIPVQLDVDLAGQWVAAEVTLDSSIAPRILAAANVVPRVDQRRAIAPMAVPQISEWLQVNSLGVVELPTSQVAAANGGQLAVLSSTNDIVGWTDISLDETANETSGGEPGTDVDDLLDEKTIAILANGSLEKELGGGIGSQSGPDEQAPSSDSTGLIIGITSLLIAFSVGIFARRRRKLTAR